MSVVFTKAPFLDLMEGAADEGLVDIGGPTSDMQPEARARYADLLVQVLLYEKAVAVVPPHVSEGIDCEPLLREGLIEFATDDASTIGFHSGLSRLYRAAYEHFREAERDSRFAPLISLDEIGLERSASMGLETELSEAAFGTNQLVALLEPWMRQYASELETIHADEFGANLAVVLGLHDEYTRESLLGFPLKPDNYGDFAETTLLHDLGLRKMTAAEFEWGQLALPYHPDDLETIWDIERALTRPGVSFEEEFNAAMLIGMRPDPLRFLKTHAYWLALFELHRATSVSAESGDPILSSSPTGPASARPDSNDFAQVSRDRTAMYRVALLEGGNLPRVESFQDVLRLREDGRFRSLQARISAWQDAISAGEINELADLRRSISSQASKAVRIEGVARAGRLLTWIAAPVAVYDATHGSLLGLPVAFAAVAVDAIANRLRRPHSWVRLSR